MKYIYIITLFIATGLQGQLVVQPQENTTAIEQEIATLLDTNTPVTAPDCHIIASKMVQVSPEDREKLQSKFNQLVTKYISRAIQEPEFIQNIKTVTLLALNGALSGVGLIGVSMLTGTYIVEEVTDELLRQFMLGFAIGALDTTGKLLVCRGKTLNVRPTTNMAISMGRSYFVTAPGCVASAVADGACAAVLNAVFTAIEKQGGTFNLLKQLNWGMTFDAAPPTKEPGHETDKKEQQKVVSYLQDPRVKKALQAVITASMTGAALYGILSAIGLQVVDTTMLDYMLAGSLQGLLNYSLFNNMPLGLSGAVCSGTLVLPVIASPSGMASLQAIPAMAYIVGHAGIQQVVGTSGGWLNSGKLLATIAHDTELIPNITPIVSSAKTVGYRWFVACKTRALEYISYA